MIATAVLSTNTLYRIGVRQASGSGTGVLQAYLATGDAAFGRAFASSTSETIANSAAEVRIGATNANAVNATVDDIRLDSGNMPGPSGSGGATSTPTNTPTGTDRHADTDSNTHEHARRPDRHAHGHQHARARAAGLRRDLHL